MDISDVVTKAGWAMINAGPGTGVYLPVTTGTTLGSLDAATGARAGAGAGRLVVAFWGRRLGQVVCCLVC